MAGLGRKVFAAGEILTAADLQGYAVDQSVMRFADSAARGSAIPTPSEGMPSYLDDLNRIEVYDGSAWKPVGTVLQVVSTTKTDTFSTASTSFVDVTGLSATITPSSTTSKILVSFHVHAGQSTALFTYFQLLRDSTAIALGDADGSRARVTALTYSGTSDNTSQLNPNVGEFLDSPATTSAVTYKLQMRVNTGTGYVNRTALDTNNTTYMRAISGITVMEVAA